MGVVIHSHPVYDSDEHYTIDPISRNITNVKSKKTSLIQYDHNSERFSFDIPRYVEGHDMTLCNKVEIHYLNLDSMKRERRVGVYEVEDLMVTTEDDQVAVFTWLISQNCTELAGSLSYIIMFACVEDGETTYRWHTAINASIIIAKGMNNEEAITAPLEFPDILQQWKEELFTKDWAYESAKSHGFEGTAEEWLASLHGADGYSPTVTTATIANGTTVTITDVNGAHSFNVLNGADGKDGTNGTNGKDGTNGVDGDDGVSPTVTVTDISGGHRITITDANGSKSFDVMNGTNEISEAILDYMSTYVYIGEIEPTSGPTLWFDTSSRS